MPRHDRLNVLTTMMDVGVVPVFYHGEFETARRVLHAVAEGGCPLLEFTNRGDHAWEVFSKLDEHCRRELPEMRLGVGSVVDAPTAGMYINCGASFVVGPVLNADVARVCNRRCVPYSPGCGSASEVSQAHELGCEVVKIFPGSQVGGPGFVKSIRGPMPWTRIMPTGGVEPTEESLREWFGAGVSCVGMGSKLLTKDLIEKGDWAGLTARVKEVVERVKAIRSA